MNTDQNSQIGAFVLRISLGAMFLAHGLLLKVFIFGVAGTAGFFESLGLPAAFAYLTIVAETIGGLLLIAGVGTRYVSAALIPVLLGALVLVHGDKGWVFSNAGGGWEYPAFLIAASVAQFFLGDGAYTLKATGLKPAVQH